MLKKRYIIIYIAILSLFGFTWQEQVAVPNQELILQFSDANSDSDKAKGTIALVKAELKRIGVKHIKVKTLQNGTLKITYYSHSGVETIKRILHDIGEVSIDGKRKSSTPSPSKEETSLGYYFDIYEIQNETYFSKGLNSTQRIVFDIKSNRLQEPNPYFFSKIIQSQLENERVKLAHTTYFNPAIVIDHISKNIPEVRAGPLS